MTASIVKPASSLIPAHLAQEQKIVIFGNWESFKLIQQGFAEAPKARLAYFENWIEIVMPGFKHEQFAEIIAYLVTTFLLERGIGFYPAGSVTQEKDGEVSAQADKSYYLGRSKPIADLSIEVVVSSGGIDKLPRYQALGVPEVWFWEDGTLKLFHLRSTGYDQLDRSELEGLRDLDIDLLKRCILQAETDFAAAVQTLRQGITTP